MVLTLQQMLTLMFCVISVYSFLLPLLFGTLDQDWFQNRQIRASLVESGATFAVVPVVRTVFVDF